MLDTNSHSQTVPFTFHSHFRHESFWNGHWNSSSPLFFHLLPPLSHTCILFHSINIKWREVSLPAPLLIACLFHADGESWDVSLPVSFGSWWKTTGASGSLLLTNRSRFVCLKTKQEQICFWNIFFYKFPSRISALMHWSSGFVVGISFLLSDSSPSCRHQRFEKAFLLAVDLQDRGLFMVSTKNYNPSLVTDLSMKGGWSYFFLKEKECPNVVSH